MLFRFPRAKWARALVAWIFFVFLLSIFIPGSVSHTGGYANVYTNSVEAFHTSFLFSTDPFAHLAPGMPLLLGLASFVGPLWPEHVRLLQFALYAALVALSYALARLVFDDRRIGIVAASIMAFSPTVLIQIFSLGPDLLYAVALLTGVLFALRLERGKGNPVFNAAISGVAFGYGALTDPVGLYVPAVVAVWLFFSRVACGTSLRRALGISALVLAASALVILPWYARNIVVFGVQDAPVVQKVIEREVITNLRSVQLVTYPFLHRPLQVLDKVSSMTLVPPDLNFLDANTVVSYRTLVKDILFEKEFPAPREFRILTLKSGIVGVHAALMALALFGLFLGQRKSAASLTVLLGGYTTFAVIGYASLSLFQGISPLNEFLIPLYGLIYAFSALSLVRIYDRFRLQWFCQKLIGAACQKRSTISEAKK